MKKEMLINVLQQEECRIAIVEDGVLEELYVERSSQESYVGNIYKGRIVNIEPSIQAAFVDFGIGRNGFLHVSDVDPAYYKHLLSKADLAEYEADMNREYGGGSGSRERRPRERGREPQPRPLTTWLDSSKPAASVSAPDGDDFSSGLDDDLPTAEPMPDPITDENEVRIDSRADEAQDDDFGAGLTEFTPAQRPAPVRPAPARRVEPVRPKAQPAYFEDDDFGAGIVDESRSVEPVTTPDSTSDDIAVESNDSGTESQPDEKPPELQTKRGRSRKTRDRAEEPSGENGGEKGEGPGKGRSRRTRKKPDGEAQGDKDRSGDDSQKYMGGAEHRTTPGDEPEITPFFDEFGGFDPNAPNDRFSDTTKDAEEVEPFNEPPREIPSSIDDDSSSGAETETGVPQQSGAIVGRGFNDSFEDRRPPRRDRDRDRSDRGDRDRGGRGRGRYRERGDRSERGGRERDRGTPSGGFKGGRDRGLPKPKIEEIFKRGQEVIVQVIKEAVGTKGPTLSTYISIAGRYLVLMPSLNRVGVSRKIEDHDARRRLREIMLTLSPPKGVGFIVRTAAIDRDAKELRNDLAYLLRLWQVVVKRIKRVSGPVEIYRESDMITRTIRDMFTNDISTIWVDGATAFAHASEFLQIVMPKFASRIRYFESSEPLFHKYAIEEEIQKIHQKRIDMPLGGSLVIEQTEALVAIDVNSGNFRAENNAEETAFQMNLHAAKEIARQLRLRDLGGVIVNDFIDMRSETHRRKVEDALRDALRRDRARTKILRISQFGIIEMTRQRIRPSLKRSIFSDCPHCRGGGLVKTSESLSIDAMRLLQLAAHRTPAIASVQLGVHVDVAHYLLNKRRKDIAALEERAKFEIQVTGQSGVSPDTLTIRCLDHNGNEIRLLPPAPVPRFTPNRPGGRGDRGRDRSERDRSDREDRDRR